MPLINEADNIFVGSMQVDKVYLGTTQVWPPAVSAPSFTTSFTERLFEPLGVFVTEET
jgi:hypothetical protein